MKLKSLMALLLIFFAAVSQAQVTVNVFINGIKSGQYAIKQDQTDGGIWYKKSVYKQMDRLSIEVKGKELNNAMYKRMVEAVDDNSKSLLVAPETPGVVGQFILTDKGISKRLGKGKIVKLYLQMDPANEKSKVMSKRIFIGNLTAK
jgi:hypothetical protein